MTHSFGHGRRLFSLLLAAAVALALVPLTMAAAPADAQIPGEDDPARTWYFAEGNTLPGWYEFLVMINPDPTRDITVTIDYQVEEPAGVAQPGKSVVVDVAAGQRRTVNVFEDVQGVGRSFTGVAARLTASHPFIAERPMYFINNFDVGAINGAHDALGVNAPSSEWFFAEGSTLQTPAPGVTTPQSGLPDQLRGFMPFFTMQNTSGADANVTVTYYTDNPDSVVTKTVSVPNNGRVTTDISNAYANPAYPGALGPNFEGFGTRITSDQPIIVERPFYANRDFDGLGPINAATAEHGAPIADGTQQLFAEGTVLADFQEFLALFNPNESASEVEVTYYVENAAETVTKTITLDPLARRTIQVFNDADPAAIGRTIPNASAPGSAGVSVKLESTNGVGFVAERPTYFVHDFGNGVVNGAHTTLGADAADASWFFAEGTTRPGFFEFVTIQNANDQATNARLDYFVDNAAPVTTVRAIPANARVTVSVYNPASEASFPGEADFGLRVTSVNDSGQPDPLVPLVVERPIYVNTPIAGSAENINGGHDTLGYRLSVPPPLPDTPVLVIDKVSEPAPVTAGEEMTYTITLENTDGVTATGVVITDTLPVGPEFVRASDDAVVNTDTITPTVSFAIGDLPVGLDVTRTIVLRPDEAGAITNTVEARSENAGFAEDDDTNVVLEPMPTDADLEVTKSAPASVGSNDVFDYEITVTNNGPGIAAGVSVSDTLPARLATDTIDAACSQDADGTVVCDVLGGLLPGQTATFVITVQSPAGCSEPRSDVFINRARVTATTTDPDPTNDTAEVSTSYEDSNC